ncbi:MAG: hypothetical protein HDS84_07000 [Bacteroidales bacterium]|nr:hypothetical protein [Bacteroidales bacterium]
MRPTNVGTWRAKSELYGDVMGTVFAQTWHATSLHSSGKVCSQLLSLFLQYKLFYNSNIHSKSPSEILIWRL